MLLMQVTGSEAVGAVTAPKLPLANRAEFGAGTIMQGPTDRRDRGGDLAGMVVAEDRQCRLRKCHLGPPQEFA